MRNAGSTPTRRVIAPLAAAVLIALPAHADDVADLIGFLRARLPTQGAVEILFEDQQAETRMVVGFDAGTGAWYKLGMGKVFGRDAEGHGFSGTLAEGVHADAYYGRRWSDDAIDSELPWVMLLGILDRPEVIGPVRSRDSGGFTFGLTFPTGARSHVRGTFPEGFDESDRTITIDVDERAHVVAITNESGYRQEYEYADGSPPLMPVPIAVGYQGGWRMKDFRHWPTDAGERFTMSTVVTRSRQVGTAGRDDVIRIDPAAPGQTSPSTSRGIRQYGTALIWGGIVFVAIGVVAIWRRSRS